MIIIIGMVIEVLVFVVVTGADLGKGAVGAPPPPCVMINDGQR